VLESLSSANDDLSRVSLWNAAKGAAAKAKSTCGEAPETAAVGEYAMQAARLSAEAGRFDEIYTGLAALDIDNSETLKRLIIPKLMQHLLATGNVEEGRRLRDTFLPAITPASAAQDYAGLADGFIQWVAEDKAHWLTATTLNSNKLNATLYNFLPSSELKSLAGDGRFDAKQKALLTRVAWTRDYARTGKTNEQSLAEMLASNPELAATHDKVKKEYPYCATRVSIFW
jgi:hypothetical protein